jgi:hypothetical protein|tara:strand:- start:12645 stop:12845 length:201 start_codon:yes stop_codon:yes gene_type:complete
MRKNTREGIINTGFLLEGFLFWIAGFYVMTHPIVSFTSLGLAILLGLWVGDQLKQLGVDEYRKVMK